MLVSVCAFCTARRECNGEMTKKVAEGSLVRLIDQSMLNEKYILEEARKMTDQRMVQNIDGYHGNLCIQSIISPEDNYTIIIFIGTEKRSTVAIAITLLCQMFLPIPLQHVFLFCLPVCPVESQNIAIAV